MDLGYRTMIPLIPAPLKKLRHLGDDFNKEDQFAAQPMVVDSIECAQKLLRLSGITLLSPGADTREQAAKQVVHLFTLKHDRTPHHLYAHRPDCIKQLLQFSVNRLIDV
jgi:hypothetical protein